MTPHELKVALQSRGLRGAGGLTSRRAGGAGPSDALALFIGDLVASVPVGARYVRRSPYTLKRADSGWLVLDGETQVGRCEPVSAPLFYRRRTEQGVPFRAVALRHGRDCIGSTVVQACERGPERCKFCAISSSVGSGETVPVKRPQDLAAVARAADSEGFRHCVLTTGYTGADAGIARLVECARAVHRSSGMRVHVQFDPPADLDLVAAAAEAADSAAVNIESFDERTLGMMAPAKARTGVAGYREVWSRAVEAFGPGQVTSFLIIGLGESEESLLRGTAELASLGVFPFLLPLRPLPGTPLENWAPPPEHAVMRIYEKARRVVEREGLDPGDCLAGCVRCGACTGFTDLF